MRTNNSLRLMTAGIALVLGVVSSPPPVVGKSLPTPLLQKDEAPEKVRYRGRWVTLEEKEARERGLVEHDGEWVTKAEKKLLKKGLVRYRGRWMSKKDRDQRMAGLLPAGKEWVPRAEADAMHSVWEKGWELEGMHFFVRSDLPEELASELLMALEATYPHFQDFFLGKAIRKAKKKRRTVADVVVPGGKMPVFVFKDKEGYREFCRSQDAEGLVHSPGFFDSELECYITYDGGLGKRTLITRTVGAVSEMYTWYAWNDRVPFWFAEGAKLYFEMVDWDPKSESIGLGRRYDTLVEFVKKRGVEPFDDFLRHHPHELGGNLRWAWGGQCWALMHFISSEAGSEFRDSWDKVCQRYFDEPSFTDLQEDAEDVGARLFEKEFKGKRMAALEKALSKYIDSL